MIYFFCATGIELIIKSSDTKPYFQEINEVTSVKASESRPSDDAHSIRE